MSRKVRPSPALFRTDGCMGKKPAGERIIPALGVFGSTRPASGDYSCTSRLRLLSSCTEQKTGLRRGVLPSLHAVVPTPFARVSAAGSLNDLRVLASFADRPVAFHPHRLCFFIHGNSLADSPIKICRVVFSLVPDLSRPSARPRSGRIDRRCIWKRRS